MRVFTKGFFALMVVVAVITMGVSTIVVSTYVTVTMGDYLSAIGGKQLEE